MASSTQNADRPSSIMQRANESSQNPFRISKEPGDLKGRTFVARRNIEQGMLLFKEDPVCWAFNMEFQHGVCSGCAQPSQRAKVCSGCKCVMFCSESCEKQSAQTHAVICKVLPQLRPLAEKCNVDADLARIALIFCASFAVSSSSSPFDWRDLVSHEESVDPRDRQQMHDVAVALLKQLTTASGLAVSKFPTADVLVRFMCTVNANAHTLELGVPGSGMGASFGTGLFPLASIMNQSCAPNCVFYNEGYRLCVRTIRAVEAGEELCVNYVTLYQTTVRRRRELRQTKQFHCMCERCSLLPLTSSMETNRIINNDCFVQAVYCTNPGCASSSMPSNETLEKEVDKGLRDKGFYERLRPAKLEVSTSAEGQGQEKKNKKKKKKKNQKKLGSENKGDDAGGGEDDEPEKQGQDSSEKPGTGQGNPQKDAKKDAEKDVELKLAVEWAALEKAQEEEPWKCWRCGHSKSWKELEEIELPIRAQVVKALQEFTSSEKSSTPTRKRAVLQAVHDTASRVLHPRHEVMFELLLPLVQCCAALGDVKAEIDYARRSLTMTEAVMPTHFPALLPHFSAVFSALQKNVKAKPSKDMEREAAVMQQRQLDILRVCLGKGVRQTSP